MVAVGFWDSPHGPAGAGEVWSARLVQAGTDRGSSATRSVPGWRPPAGPPLRPAASGTLGGDMLGRGSELAVMEKMQGAPGTPVRRHRTQEGEEGGGPRARHLPDPQPPHCPQTLPDPGLHCGPRWRGPGTGECRIPLCSRGSERSGTNPSSSPGRPLRPHLAAGTGEDSPSRSRTVVLAALRAPSRSDWEGPAPARRLRETACDAKQVCIVLVTC